MKKPNIIHEKSYAFSKEVISVYKQLTKEKREFILSKQLLKSGTAICALVKEAEYAQSKPDFLNKMNVALKEANETVYWITLLRDTDHLSKESTNQFLELSKELVKILSSIVLSTKKTIGRF